jgi:hypothetical protein
LVFLGSVAAATYAAHKFWPKGITYGDKEDWELEKAVKKSKEKKAAGSDDGSYRDGPSRSTDDRLNVHDRRSDRGYERPRSSHGRLGIADAPVRRGGPPEVDEIIYVRRPMASRALVEDARRMPFVEDSRVAYPDRRSYISPRDRQHDDYRGSPRYAVADSRPRRYSFDDPPDPRRSERVVYVREDDYR